MVTLSKTKNLFIPVIASRRRSNPYACRLLRHFIPRNDNLTEDLNLVYNKPLSAFLLKKGQKGLRVDRTTLSFEWVSRTNKRTSLFHFEAYATVFLFNKSNRYMLSCFCKCILRVNPFFWIKAILCMLLFLKAKPYQEV